VASLKSQMFRRQIIGSCGSDWCTFSIVIYWGLTWGFKRKDGQISIVSKPEQRLFHRIYLLMLSKSKMGFSVSTNVLLFCSFVDLKFYVIGVCIEGCLFLTNFRLGKKLVFSRPILIVKYEE
jgi:hypothetical protein